METAELYRWIAPTVVSLTVIAVIPLLAVVAMSFHTDITDTAKFTGVDNYTRIVSAPNVWQSLGVTGGLVLSTLVVEISFGLAAAVLIHRTTRSAYIKAAMVLPLMVTPVVAALLWRLMLNPELGIVNQLLSFLGVDGVNWLATPVTAQISVLLVDLWQWTPFVTVLSLVGLESVPQAIQDTARTDGATSLQRLWHVELPMIRELVYVIGLFRVLDVTTLFDTVYILTKGGPGMSTETLSVHIYRHTFKLLDFGYGAALSVIFMLLTAVLCYVFFSTMRRDTSG